MDFLYTEISLFIRLGLIFLVVFFAVCLLPKYILYLTSTYRKDTKKSVFKVLNDVGAQGEYRIYKCLRKYEKQGARFLFNTYLPKGESGETTEIDVIMICYQGIFVFESKNYSGWIFGNEKYKTWTQTLPQGKGRKAKKEKFLNPIMQNKLHIGCLQEVLGDDLENVPIFSVVVFSNRCELKKIELSSNEAVVIKREKLPLLVKKYCKVKPFLTYEMIEELYKTLYPLTQFSDDVKKKHIEDIQKHF